MGYSKEVSKECDHDESTQFDCETQRRMNGHVKNMHFQQHVERAASKFNYISYFEALNIIRPFFL